MSILILNRAEIDPPLYLFRPPVVSTMPRQDPQHRPLEDLPQLRQGDQVVAANLQVSSINDNYLI